MIEMLVVLGIIGLVSAITLPMLVPMMRTRTLDSAVDTVKTACNLARSTAIQQRRMINLTFLQQTDSAHGPAIVMTPYAFAGAVTTGGSQTVITDNNQNWNTSFQNCQLLLFSTPAEMKKALQNASPWNVGHAYSLDDIVSDRNALYKCVEPNTGSEPPNPSWEVISSPQTRTIESNTGSTITFDQTVPGPNGAPQGPWYPLPARGDVYAVMSSMSSSSNYCIHNLGNYSYNFNLGPSVGPAPADVRFNVLKTLTQYAGQTVQYLPTGC
jgi:type II secretory pathway pseudopilin PulG